MQSNQNSGNLDQQLLELVYDVLSDEETAELRRRIASEPAVAAAYKAVDGVWRTRLPLDVHQPLAIGG